MTWWQEFKAFAVRGNVIDLAIAVVIGTAFGRVTASLVADVIMPPLGLLLGGVEFSALVITLKEATETTAAVTINYGVFIQTIVNFLIIAWAMFLVVKAVNVLKRKQEEAPAAEKPVPPPRQEILLAEIRDLLKAAPSTVKDV